MKAVYTLIKATVWKFVGAALFWRAIAALACVTNALAAAPFHWESVSPYPNLVGNSVAFGKGRFVATADDRTLAISEDAGRTWNRLSDLPPQDYSVVHYANGQFVAIGTDKVIVSQDGLAWSSYAVTNVPGILTLNYWNGRFVATGGSGIVSTSMDGQSWNSTNITDKSLSIVAVGPDELLAVDSGIVLLHSTDGVSWTKQPAKLPSPGCVGPFCYSWNAITGLAWFQGRFVAQVSTLQSDLAGPAVTLTSTNGTDWVEVRRTTFDRNRGWLTLNDRLIERNAPSYNPAVMPEFTTDLTNWQAFSLKGDRIAESEPALAAGAFGEGTYVVTAGRTVLRGVDLLNLERIDSPEKGASLSGIAVDGNTMVGVQFQADPVLVVSTNGGRRFELVPAPAGSGSLKAVEFAQGKFVAVGNGGTVIRTTNGYALSRRLSNTSADLADVAFGNGQWLAVGANGTIISSPDASVFSLRNSGTAISLNSVTFGMGLFVAVGQSGLILTSTNGQNWSGQGTDDAQDLLAVAYGDGTFVATGNNGIVHASTNGVDWSSATVPGVDALTSVGFANGLFFAIGAQPSWFARYVYSSPDGLNWSGVSFPFRPGALDDSDGTVWCFGGDGAGIGGDGTYIAKAVFELNLNAHLNANGQFVLGFHAGKAGTYEIVSTDSLSAGSWQLRETLTNVSGPITWTNLQPTTATRFYSVRRR